MNTRVIGLTDNITIATRYYDAMLAKDFEVMTSCLDDNVHFIGPLAEMRGKESVATAAKNFGEILQNIEIRSRFASGAEIMFAYDMTMPEPIGKFRAAVLMEFADALISKIELFYDASLFQVKKGEIFDSAD